MCGGKDVKDVLRYIGDLFVTMISHPCLEMDELNFNNTSIFLIPFLRNEYTVPKTDVVVIV